MTFSTASKLFNTSLKPENILMSSTGYLKLTDFGLAKEKVLNNEGAKTLLGTPEYIAPEILKGKQYGRQSDWWAFGCVIYEMLKGFPPFYSTNRKVMFNSIVNEEVQDWSSLDGTTVDFLSRLLDKNPET